MHYANTIDSASCGARIIFGNRTTNFDDVTCRECRALGPGYGPKSPDLSTGETSG